MATIHGSTEALPSRNAKFVKRCSGPKRFFACGALYEGLRLWRKEQGKASVVVRLARGNLSTPSDGHTHSARPSDVASATPDESCCWPHSPRLEDSTGREAACTRLQHIGQHTTPTVSLSTTVYTVPTILCRRLRARAVRRAPHRGAGPHIVHRQRPARTCRPGWARKKSIDCAGRRRRERHSSLADGGRARSSRGVSVDSSVKWVLGYKWGLGTLSHSCPRPCVLKLN